MRRLAPCIFLVCCFYLYGQDKSLLEKKDYVTVFEGFQGGGAYSGRWRIEGDRLVQKDPAARFAYFRVPFAHEKTNYIFSYTLRSSASGWTGGGLHIFASGNKSAARYAYGSSILIWLTRDQAYYRNGSTYLQLYRSIDDASMIQLASVSLQENLSDEMKVEIYCNEQMDILSVTVNGDLKLFFPMKGIPFQGSEVVFRALGGPISFNDFHILKAQK